MHTDNACCILYNTILYQHCGTHIKAYVMGYYIGVPVYNPIKIVFPCVASVKYEMYYFCLNYCIIFYKTVFLLNNVP